MKRWAHSKTHVRGVGSLINYKVMCQSFHKREQQIAWRDSHTKVIEERGIWLFLDQADHSCFEKQVPTASTGGELQAACVSTEITLALTNKHPGWRGKEIHAWTMSTTSLSPTLRADGIDFLALETLLSGGPRALTGIWLFPWGLFQKK